MVLRPYISVSELYRVGRERDGVQHDFTARVDGIRLFETLRARAMRAEFENVNCWPRSSTISFGARRWQAASRISPCSPFCEGRGMKRKRRTKPARDSALRNESDRALVKMIRRQLALPPALNSGG